MPDQVPGRWNEVQTAFQFPAGSDFLVLGAMLLLGGVLAMYVRQLYRWTSAKSTSGSIARVFPLLTLVTIAVIAVVKGSLALSLGLVGALSIVRFRAAIKDPEELVYLFLCIGIGLALGAIQVWLALALVAAASLFALIFDRIRLVQRRGDAFLTISTPSSPDGEASASEEALKLVRSVCPRLTLERCEFDGEEGQLRIQLHDVDPDSAPQLLARLRTSMPGCRVSWMNAELLP